MGIAGIIAYLIERLHSREMQYRTVFEYSQLGIVVFDEHTEAIQHCNRKFADMLHFTGKELQAMTFPALLFIPAELDRFRERMNRNTEIEDFDTGLKQRLVQPAG